MIFKIRLIISILLVQQQNKSKLTFIEGWLITCSFFFYSFWVLQQTIISIFSKAQALIGSESFNRVYNYLHDQHKKQTEDPTHTDEIILSGLQGLTSNSYASTLINELVLHECLDELNERTNTS